MRQQPPLRPALAAGRVVFAVFGLAFFGIGLAVIGAMWFGEPDGFGSPPLFFKVVASLIALPFVAMGGTLAASAIFGGGLLARHAGAAGPTVPHASPDPAPPPPGGPAGYACPHCGAALRKTAEVSPMGDARCAFCGQWFNVHGRRP